MIVRVEEPQDRATIHAVVRAAFGRAAEAALVDQLRVDGDGAISLVAVDHDGIIGHVMLSRIQAPFAALGLAPYPVTLDEMLANVRSFEAIQRSVKSGAIEAI